MARSGIYMGVWVTCDFFYWLMGTNQRGEVVNFDIYG